jgi:hypothetical protein
LRAATYLYNESEARKNQAPCPGSALSNLYGPVDNGVTLDHLRDRRDLLAGPERFRRAADARVQGMDARLPRLDQGVSALVQDLHDRGLDRDVVVVWGEFGRTPRVNAMGGRDHWHRVSCALLAGGGMKTGQVIGSPRPGISRRCNDRDRPF